MLRLFCFLGQKSRHIRRPFLLLVQPLDIRRRDVLKHNLMSRVRACPLQKIPTKVFSYRHDLAAVRFSHPAAVQDYFLGVSASPFGHYEERGWVGRFGLFFWLRGRFGGRRWGYDCDWLVRRHPYRIHAEKEITISNLLRGVKEGIPT